MNFMKKFLKFCWEGIPYKFVGLEPTPFKLVTTHRLEKMFNKNGSRTGTQCFVVEKSLVVITQLCMKHILEVMIGKTLLVACYIIVNTAQQ